MAKDLNRSIKIYIDNSDAMKRASDLQAKIEQLRNKLEDLNNQGKKDSVEYIKTETKVKELSAAYDRWKDKVYNTERVLKNLSGATKSELLQVQKELNKSLNNTARDTDEYKAKLQALTAVKKELAVAMAQENSLLGKNATLRSRIAEGFNKYFGIITSVIAGVTGISYTFRKLAEDVAKMDDVYSDVMKTTNMTRNEVVELNNEFKKMDTRTAREELNRLARDAGKLGLEGKKDVLDFVEAGNQINVALGDDLGDGAIKNIGKMTDVYIKSTKELESMDLKGRMLAIGSAINELGMASTASEPYMVNFAKRLGGVGSQANIAIYDILGYASALDQSGQAVEMSATAMQKFIMKLMSDPAKFAKMAGIEIKEFNKLLQEDTNQAIKTTLKALSEKGGFQALIPIFKDMGLDGARAVGVLSALATNIDKVNEAQEVSKKAFLEGISITNEYSIKNNNLQAKLEKARKQFKDAALELGESLNPALLTSTKFTTYLIKNMPKVLDFLGTYGKYVLYLITVYATYRAGVKLAAATQTAYNAVITISRLRKIQLAVATTSSATAQAMYNRILQNGSVLTKAYTAATSLLSAAKYLLTGNITKARQAMQVFNITAAANPAGIVATLVLALVAAFGYLLIKVNSVMTSTKAIKKATEEFNGELATEQGKIDRLFAAYKKTNPESEEHRRIRDKIIEQYKTLIPDLIDEEGRITDIAEAHKRVNKNLREQIALKIKNAATEKIQTEGIKDQLGKVNDVIKNVNKQLHLSIEEQNELREEINRKINEIALNENWSFTDLQSELENIVERYGADIRYKTGFFEPKSLYMEIASLSSSVHNTRKEITAVTNQFAGLISDATELNSILGGEDKDTITTVDPDDLSDKELKKLVQKQKKELSLLLEQLETKHQEKLFEIKQDYRKGDIQSESEYNSRIFSQEQAYYILRENALQNYLKKVSDKELKSDIEKKIAEIQNKRIDSEIKYRQKLDKILLDADPLAKEKKEYENRLRDAGVYGYSKNALLLEIAEAGTEDEKKLLEKKIEVLELLEKQHTDNLVKIRKNTKAKLKAAAEENFEEEFGERKRTLQEEIDAETQILSIQKNTGSLSDEKLFNAEVALQQKKLALIREEIEARRKAGLDISKLLKNQEKEELNLTKIYTDEYNKRKDQYTQYTESLGNAIGNVLSNQETALQAFGNSILDILFDVLTKIIDTKLAEATAVAIAEQAKAAAISAAQPDSVVSFGATAAARTAAISAIIMGALAAAKSTLKGLISGNKSSSKTTTKNKTTTTGVREVSQNAAGKYDVIGQEDKKLYRNVPYTGIATTGVVARPTLVGEQGSELVVSHPDFIALQKHMNYPLVLQAIQDVRNRNVPQRAAGKYDTLPNASIPNNSGVDTELIKLMGDVVTLLKKISTQPIPAQLNITQFEKEYDRHNRRKQTISKT